MNRIYSRGQSSLYDELIIDSFAGGGGASTGIELAIGRPVDVAINHDPDAIEMHRRNHPYTRHYCESVWEVDPRDASGGRHVGLFWLSPDCTHHSKARGGKPRKKEIRGLAWVAVRWAATVRPRVIALENVEEFVTWGPLDKSGQPDKTQAGRTFTSFVNALRNLGYTVGWRELRACDYGAPTIRKRLFLIARCDGAPIVWPEPTHAAPDSEAVKSGRLKPWRTAAEVIDWTLPCPSIFATSDEIWQEYGLRAIRPLAEATLQRIARGIKKFVIDNPEPFIVDFKYANTPADINDPLRTITGVNGYGLVQPKIAPTLIQYHDEQGKGETRGQSATTPVMTIDTSNRYGLVMTFMSKYFDGNYKGAGNCPADPLNTITAWDHNALVTSQLTLFRNHSDGQTLNDPLNTVMTSPGHFGEVRALLVKYYGQGEGQPATDPLHTVTAKDRMGLVTVHGQQYAITDIGLRMLTPRELFNAQGFPPDYIIDIGDTGKPMSKAAQVARCGNAVPPPFSEAILRANLPELCGKRIETMAELMREMAG